jgi:hypothetical protein
VKLRGPKRKYETLPGESVRARRLRLKREYQKARKEAELTEEDLSPPLLPRIERVGNKTIHRCYTREIDNDNEEFSS